MAYHDELLLQANELAHKHQPTQADLRRSVSSAYYALFHLLIFEASLNWSNDVSRPGLARMFGHDVMKKVPKKVTDAGKMPYPGEEPIIVGKLRTFAGLFVRLQENDLLLENRELVASDLNGDIVSVHAEASAVQARTVFNPFGIAARSSMTIETSRRS